MLNKWSTWTNVSGYVQYECRCLSLRCEFCGLTWDTRSRVASYQTRTRFQHHENHSVLSVLLRKFWPISWVSIMTGPPFGSCNTCWVLICHTDRFGSADLPCTSVEYLSRNEVLLIRILSWTNSAFYVPKKTQSYLYTGNYGIQGKWRFSSIHS